MLIGIGGIIGSGKDEIAKYLIEKHGFIRLGFADALKQEVAERLRRTLRAYLWEHDCNRHDGGAMIDGKTCTSILLNHTPKQIETWWDKRIHHALWVERTDVTRALLQEYGTEVRRADDPEYWVEKWTMAYMFYEEADGSFVVPDVRFINEALTIKAMQGHLIYVSRDVQKLDHESESNFGHIKWDTIIENDSTIDGLHAAVDKWITTYGKAENSADCA